MQSVVCPSCSAELGEAEDEGDWSVSCPFCGEVFDVDAVEDLAEMYRRHEEEDRERWIPDRQPRTP